jgi:anti-anti-sigma factor
MSLEKDLRAYNERHPHAPVASRMEESGDLVFSLAGDLEMKATSEIGPLIESALLECRPRGRLLLDMESVGYISSTGVGLLANIMVKAEKLSITFVLCDIPPRVKAVMDTLGLLSFFNVEGCGG